MTLKISNEPLWHSTERITTPSIVISKSGETKYIPLFVGQDQEEIQQSDYYYKLGKLKVSKAENQYRACESARYQKTISDTLSTTITHSGKTGTSVTYPSKTKSGTVYGRSTVPPGGGYCTVSDTVSFGVTFTTIQSKSSNLTVNSAKNGGTVTKSVQGTSSTSASSTVDWSASWSVKGTVKTTTTTYPTETRSNTASKQVEYGITFSSAPTTLVADNECTVTNNSGNSNCTVSKTLSGTVEYNKTATLTQDFNVTVGSSL